MADRNERDRDDERKREEHVKDDSGQSEATPGSDRDDEAYDSASGGPLDEIEDENDAPPHGQRGRDLEH